MSTQKGNEQANMSLVGHLREIRNRIALSVVALLAAFVICFAIIKPLANAMLQMGLDAGFQYVYLSPSELLTSYFKLALVLAVVVVSPLLIFQIWGFVAPALIEDWGISRAEMGPILGAAMFGVAIGALVAGPLSDRYGRKRILLWSVALFALFSLAGAVAQSPTQLALMRFLTGLGLGAVMPNCVTLVAEYMPERRKGVMITLMYSGFNVGSGLGGFIAAGLLSHYSWHSALVFGGVLPLVVLPFMIVMLPESAMNMVARRLPGEQIARALNRLGGQFTAETVFQLNAPPITRSSKVAQLFRHGYARGTIALWLTYFMGLFVIYLLNGWLPTILRSGGRR